MLRNVRIVDGECTQPSQHPNKMLLWIVDRSTGGASHDEGVLLHDVVVVVVEDDAVQSPAGSEALFVDLFRFRRNARRTPRVAAQQNDLPQALLRPRSHVAPRWPHYTAPYQHQCSDAKVHTHVRTSYEASSPT